MARRLGLALLLGLAGCATQPAAHAGPGFFHGVLHGLIAPFSLLASLILPVRIYAFPNSGFGYDLGFVLGFGLFAALAMLLSAARIGGFLTREGRD
ncbi:MAG TPA: hypothetical protein VHC39_01170 [Rhizomicrobium sp.]|nr:hypothetical protein [Rhizomicrobium sp.]